MRKPDSLHISSCSSPLRITKEIIMATVWSVVSWFVFGLIVGLLARFLVPGRQDMSWLMTALLGIVGSVLGGAVSWAIFGTPDGKINPAGWLMSIVGAIVVVLIYGRLKGARASHP
jgi:uncharacterized membrane protein YeaQ/YmgE (transglycosylase-associated protein family)